MADRIYKRGIVVILAFVSLTAADPLAADSDELRIFGYSQNIVHQIDDGVVASNSFVLQQLNISCRNHSDNAGLPSSTSRW